MSIEKLNNPSLPESWKDKLEQMETLPGHGPIDKGQAWEKLYERLGKPTRRRNYSLLWIAAALLTGLILFFGFPSRHSEAGSVWKAKPAYSPSLKKGHSPSPTPAQINWIEKNRTARIIRQNHPFIGRSRKELPGIAVPEDRSVEIQAIAGGAFPIDVNRLSAISLLPVKKPLAVISLNELERSNSSSGNDTRIHFFRIKIYNPANLNLPSLADEQPIQPIIRIPVSSQN